MNRAVHSHPAHKHPLGGVPEMRRNDKKAEVLRLMNGGVNIVKTIKTGNATIHFADNAYACKTDEEINAAISNHWRVGWQVAMRLRERGVEV